MLWHCVRRSCSQRLRASVASHGPAIQRQGSRQGGGCLRTACLDASGRGPKAQATPLSSSDRILIVHRSLLHIVPRCIRAALYIQLAVGAAGLPAYPKPCQQRMSVSNEHAEVCVASWVRCSCLCPQRGPRSSGPPLRAGSCRCGLADGGDHSRSLLPGSFEDRRGPGALAHRCQEHLLLHRP